MHSFICSFIQNYIIDFNYIPDVLPGAKLTKLITRAPALVCVVGVSESGGAGRCIKSSNTAKGHNTGTPSDVDYMKCFVFILKLNICWLKLKFRYVSLPLRIILLVGIGKLWFTYSLLVFLEIDGTQVLNRYEN